MQLGWWVTVGQGRDAMGANEFARRRESRRARRPGSPRSRVGAASYGPDPGPVAEARSTEAGVWAMRGGCKSDTEASRDVSPYVTGAGVRRRGPDWLAP